MKSLSFFSLILLSTLLLVSCSSTSLISSWRDPGTTIDKSKLTKVLVICLVKDETTRRVGEDEIVKRNPSVLVASYNVLTSSVLRDTAAVDKAIYQGSYDGIVIMRLVSKEQATSYVQGSYPSYYYGWGGYYGYAAPYYYDPGYYQTDQYYNVETNVYSIHPDKLIWTGLTQSVNPGSIQTTIGEIANAVTYQMKKEGFLVDSAKK